MVFTKMPHKDPVKRKEYGDKYREKNREKNKERKREHYEKNREQRIEYEKERREDLKQHAHDSISSGDIIDQCKWDKWCNEIKRCANKKKHPYSDNFTNEIMFELVVQGCFYCGDIATTIDRIDSNLDHTIDNCVGCCNGCNNSKGVADPDTFIRKAYYRVRGEYYDVDTNIWFVNKKKPRIYEYEASAKKKGVPFELTKEYFDILTESDCKYCRRSSITWFGIDRVVPSLGYVIDNVVTCCYDCNLDKLEDDVDTMRVRNERIAERIENGDLIIYNYDKVILHRGINKTCKKVCAYGKLYENKQEASRAFGKGINYVGACIWDGRYQGDIFEISDGFYEEYKDSENITKTMFIGFDHYYTNM